ncbi:MAG: hypothetical protein ABFQ62_04445 [Patescibacteria group bacterium]
MTNKKNFKNIDKAEFVDFGNAREEEQARVMKESENANVCPFCQEHLDKYHKDPILKEGKYWIVTPNSWPYKHTKHQFIIIYKEHVTNLAGVDPEAGKELIEFVQWLEKEYEIPGGGWAMRFGDTDYSAGTVNHLHAHFIQPDIHASTYAEKPVKFKIGKYKKK